MSIHYRAWNVIIKGETLFIDVFQMCTQAEDPGDSVVRRVTRSVAANSQKEATSTEPNTDTPKRTGTESLICLQVMLLARLARWTRVLCLHCVAVMSVKATSERRWVCAVFCAVYRPLFLPVTSRGTFMYFQVPPEYQTQSTRCCRRKSK